MNNEEFFDTIDIAQQPLNLQEGSSPKKKLKQKKWRKFKTKNLEFFKKRRQAIYQEKRRLRKRIPHRYSFWPRLYDRKFTFKITSNNLFCTLSDIKKKKVILSASRGKYRIKISKKKIKHNGVRIIKIFCKQAKKKLTPRGVFVNLVAPIKMRYKIIRFLKRFLRHFRIKNDEKKWKRLLLIKIDAKKCFNGCRAAKRRRKKRKGLRFLK